MGRAFRGLTLMGRPGPVWAGPLWAESYVPPWALMGQDDGPGPVGPRWALMVRALVGRALMGWALMGRPGRLWAGPSWGDLNH